MLMKEEEFVTQTSRHDDKRGLRNASARRGESQTPG